MKFTYLQCFLFSFFLLGFISSCSNDRKKEAAAQQQQASAQRPPARVEGFLVQTSTVTESIEVPGTIVAGQSTEIHPEVSGRVTQLNIREGAFVQKGAILARLYDGDLQAQKRKIEVQLQIARTTEERYEALQKIGGISKQDYDVTRLNVSNLRADLDIVNTEIAKTVIRAPFSGKLGLKEISIGAYVTPASIVTSIQKTSDLRIDFNIPEKYISQIKKGQIVNFTVEGQEGSYTATVMATESGISQDNRALTVRASVRGGEVGLIPGAFAKVKLMFAPDNSAIMVPTQAIIPQARGKKVYVVKNGKAEFIEVSTGVRDSAMIQVTSGLNAGDTVIITGLLGLRPDASVVVNKVTTNKKS
ncbi:MAG: efflux RND transporter periplasmic adaptor subunit [Flavisolibacter sp.]